MHVLQLLWSFIGYLVPFVFVLSIVVFFHELGHFLVGRWCGVKVEAFSIGFGKELFSFTDRKGTRWRLALIPLGGYVKFYGDADAASMSDEELSRVMTPEQKRESLFGQSVCARSAIVAAGPFANFLLAIVIFAATFYFSGRGELSPRVARVQAGEVADVAGFKAGDLVLTINGRKIDAWGDMQRIVQASPDTKLTFTVLRDQKEVTLVATPKLREFKTPFGVNRAGMLGVVASNNEKDWKIRKYGFGESIVAGASETWFVIERTGAYIGGIVHRAGIDRPDFRPHPDRRSFRGSCQGQPVGADQSGRNSVNFGRFAQSFPDSAPGWWSFAVFCRRSRQGQAVEPDGAGDRVSHRNGSGIGADGFRDLQRHPSRWA